MTTKCAPMRTHKHTHIPVQSLTMTAHVINYGFIAYKEVLSSAQSNPQWFICVCSMRWPTKQQALRKEFI